MEVREDMAVLYGYKYGDGALNFKDDNIFANFLGISILLSLQDMTID